MAKDTLLDSRVSIKQAEKAVNALYDHASKVAAKEAESELLGSKEQHVWLNVTVKKLSAEHKLKPVKMYASLPPSFLSIHAIMHTEPLSIPLSTHEHLPSAY